MRLILSCICFEADLKFEPKDTPNLYTYVVDVVSAYCVRARIEVRVCMAHQHVCMHGMGGKSNLPHPWGFYASLAIDAKKA